MADILMDEVVCCSNTELYGEGELHCTDERNIGKKCGFCNGIYRKKEYYINPKNLKCKIIKE